MAFSAYSSAFEPNQKKISASSLEFCPGDSDPIPRSDSWDSLDQSLENLLRRRNANCDKMDKEAIDALTSVGLSIYISSFLEAGFDSMASIELLQEEDLDEMKINPSDIPRVFSAVKSIQKPQRPSLDIRRIQTAPVSAPAAASASESVLGSPLTKSFTHDGVSSSAQFFRSSASVPVPCRYFFNGFCSRGPACYFSHSLTPPEPASVELLDPVEAELVSELRSVSAEFDRLGAVPLTFRRSTTPDRFDTILNDLPVPLITSLPATPLKRSRGRHRNPSESTTTKPDSDLSFLSKAKESSSLPKEGETGPTSTTSSTTSTPPKQGRKKAAASPKPKMKWVPKLPSQM